MRPNIDISNKTHGEIKDFADQKNISVNEAYQKVIKRGLRVEKPMAIKVKETTKFSSSGSAHPHTEKYPKANPLINKEQKEKIIDVVEEGGSIIFNAKVDEDRGTILVTKPTFISNVETRTKPKKEGEKPNED